MSTPPPRGQPSEKRPYEPPRLTPLGDLRDLLAIKSGPDPDPSNPVHQRKK